MPLRHHLASTWRELAFLSMRRKGSFAFHASCPRSSFFENASVAQTAGWNGKLQEMLASAQRPQQYNPGSIFRMRAIVHVLRLNTSGKPQRSEGETEVGQMRLPRKLP
jgi:hypothetical protein